MSRIRTNDPGAGARQEQPWQGEVHYGQAVYLRSCAEWVRMNRLGLRRQRIAPVRAEAAAGGRHLLIARRLG